MVAGLYAAWLDALDSVDAWDPEGLVRAAAAVISPDPDLRLSNLAATVVNLLGYQAPDAWDRGILEFDGGAEVGTVR